MWQQHYTPLAGSIGISALAASLPIFVLLYLIGIKRKPAWVAGLSGLVAALIVAIGVYQMPIGLTIGALTYGAAFGLLPIGWIVFWAIVLYRITVETGKFDVIKDSIGGLTDDRRLQALLIGFAFGAFLEGAAGFGTPVAVAAAMMTGLGFSPFYAAGLCLLANTAPVAFGAIGTPIVTLAGITLQPGGTLGPWTNELSMWVGRICAPISLFIPTYLILVMGGWRALRGVLPAVMLCGVAFAGTQFFVSNYIGPHLTDILSSLAAICSLVLLTKMWKPSEEFDLDEHSTVHLKPKHHGVGPTLLAWSPYLFLVLFTLLWSSPTIKAYLDMVTKSFPWPGLHNLIERVPPVVGKPVPYPATYNLNLLSASGTACLMSTIAAMIVLGLPFSKYVSILVATAKQLLLSNVTIMSVVGLAYLMNYCGATATLGLAFAATGVMFPFFSSLLGWLGVFLTGSDTSANALFGNLQVVTANNLHLDPALMASANSSGGVMGKMISLQSIAVAGAATGMHAEDEGRLFRFTIKHSIFLACVLGALTMVYAYLL